ncbi:MAG: thiamine diphosphokinase [Lachnospiraceae bacterium]|uniref:Thiamine diphosphokinase n=1 Tax=Candidatus Weimeria bifida TaxID=2599074 RepID=A0A6N7IXY4_9FIRM|nr:thiamine diphosphokinase [Candidatus Weimeria bifida]RRF96662.1 MAG: thiamine diphosphokinase [Lachnospiraceae bacterium]
MQVVIIGGGSVDTETAIRVIRREKAYIIAADRGLDYCRLLHIRPDLAVGDFDSVSAGTKELLDEFARSGIRIIELNPIKDDTDLEAALDIAMRINCDTINILGATGSRVDHILGNLTLLKKAKRNGKNAVIYDRTNRIRMISGGEKFTLAKKDQYGKYISLFPLFGECQGVSATGVFYPLDGKDIGGEDGYFTLTISNEITEDKAAFFVEKGDLLVIESRD